MAKKYLSLDEAASQLGLTTAQLMRFREQGEIRGFADRGSWKFREQDIEEFLRSQQSDSSPDMPIITGDSSSSVLDEPDADDLSSSDSDVRLFFDESLFDDDDANKLASSGSDVRLTGDSGPNLEAETDDDALDLSGWESDVKLSDSDSDVKLVVVPEDRNVDLSKTMQMSEFDSDVRLADDSDLKLSDSDSDVRLSDADDLDNTNEMSHVDADADSDSDVQLMGSDDLMADDSDSDVKLSSGLDRTDSDIRLAEPSPAPDAGTIAFTMVPDDSDLKLIDKGSGVRQPAIDSGISLEVRGSGIGLDASESGLALEGDSGISLHPDDSGISLESHDSGANLGGDSGITLDAGDSGISLDLGEDSGIALDQNDMNRTMPMHVVPGAKALLDESSAMTTQMEIPAIPSGKDSEFELAGLDDDDDDVGTNTSILTFEDDENTDSSRTAAAPVSKRAAVEEEVEDEEYTEESYDDDDGTGGEYEEGDDLDVQDAEDFDDEEDFEAGQSKVAGFPSGARASARMETDWGVGVKVLIGVSTLLSILCSVIGIELVRTMWLWTQPGTSASGILQMVGNLF